MINEKAEQSFERGSAFNTTTSNLKHIRGKSRQGREGTPVPLLLPPAARLSQPLPGSTGLVLVRAQAELPCSVPGTVATS